MRKKVRPTAVAVHGRHAVLLLDQEAREMWMNAPIEEAILLQRPAANDAVRVVATGDKQDGAPEIASNKLWAKGKS